MKGPIKRPARPVMRYHGGKWRLAPWIISHFPAHRIYVEPFGGAASVLMRKERAYSDVYNDLDGEIVSLFRVLRDPVLAQQLREQLDLTPFAREEFDAAYEKTDEPIERARRGLIRAYMGFGTASFSKEWRTGFRSNVRRTGSTPAHDWQSFPQQLERFTERLRGVVIEQREALDIIARYDAPDTLHYVDPPYVPSTRREGSAEWQDAYRHEMTDDDHRRLAESLHDVAGAVVLSGYDCELYSELFGDWQSHERECFADGARPRTETVWLNPRCVELLTNTTPLFSGGAA